MEPQGPGVAELAAGTLILDGRFRIEKMLGGGGMGLVYLAEQVSLGRKVAVKVLRDDVPLDAGRLDRFRREALLLSSVEHPSVVRIIDFGQMGASACIVMEYVEGESLEAVLQREAPLTVARAERVLLQLTQGLAAIHARGIVHRDLKPENVVLTKAADGTELARLLDFGIARLTHTEQGSGVTQAGLVMGTPEYLSPEQALGQPLGPRSDLYALGVIGYRMLSGRHPFTGPTAQEFVSQHVQQAPPPLLEVAPQLAQVPLLVELVMACLAKSPDARPQTTQAVLERLQPPLLLTTTLTASLRAQAGQRAPGRLQRRLALAVAGVVMAGCLAGAFLVFWNQSERKARRLLGEGRGSEALQVIDDAGELAKTVPMKQLRATALHQVNRHDEELELMRSLPDSAELEPQAVESLADDYGHAETARVRKILAALPKVKALPLLQALAEGEQSWAQWGALRFVDVEYAGQGLPLAELCVRALDSHDCRIRALAAKRLGELRSAAAVGPLRKLSSLSRKASEPECGQDAAAAALNKLERELNP